MVPLMRFGTRVVEVDAEGYLVRAEDWAPELADAMASGDGLRLGDAHWEIIRLLREYWTERAVAPPIRALVRLAGARLGLEKGSSRYLYRLFPDGPARQGCRYAGLPRPDGCV